MSPIPVSLEDCGGEDATGEGGHADNRWIMAISLGLISRAADEEEEEEEEVGPMQCPFTPSTLGPVNE